MLKEKLEEARDCLVRGLNRHTPPGEARERGQEALGCIDAALEILAKLEEPAADPPPADTGWTSTDSGSPGDSAVTDNDPFETPTDDSSADEIAGELRDLDSVP